MDTSVEGSLYARQSLALKADRGETGSYVDIPDDELYGNISAPNQSQPSDHQKASFGQVGSAGGKLINRVQAHSQPCYAHDCVTHAC